MILIALGLTAALAALYVKACCIDESHKSKSSWSTHRATLLNFGLVLALSAISLAFEWSSTAVTYGSATEAELLPEIEIEVMRTALELPKEIPSPAIEKPTTRIDLSLIETVKADIEPIDIDIEFNIIPETPHTARVVTLKPPPPPAPKEFVERPIREIFKVVEEMPRYPGCEGTAMSGSEIQACAQKRMLEDIYKRIKYPEFAIANGVEGTAIISFVVETDGSITGATILRNPGALTGEEALRIVETFPAWIPGRQRGKAVRVQFTLPVKFRLK